ncbi:MAG: Predicted transcriptional regulator of sulfate adenylyltransferase, Rrf2 family, partial [uncultured Solirubrobacteraceae bacterium]
ADLRQGRLCRPGDGAARRVSGRRLHEGRGDRLGAGDPREVPREHPGRPAPRGPGPLPARGGGRLPPGPAGRGGHRGRRHPGGGGPAGLHPRPAPRGGPLPGRRGAAAAGLDRAAREPARRARGHDGGGHRPGRAAARGGRARAHAGGVDDARGRAPL